MTNKQQSQPLSDGERALAAGYVLGDLNDDEQRQVAVLLKHRPAMRREVKALSVSLRSLPQSLPLVAPPPALEAKILTAYAATQTVNQTAGNVEEVAIGGGAIAPSVQSTVPRSSISWSKIIAGIATLAALLLGTSNIRLRHQLAQLTDPAIPEDAPQVAQILQQPNSRLVSLQGRDETNTATAGGTLLFTAGDWQEVVVSLNNLPPLPVDQVYRMWLTLDDGNILFCGEFNTQPDGTVFVRLSPPQTPPQGVKTTGLFITQTASSAPQTPDGIPLMVGEI